MNKHRERRDYPMPKYITTQGDTWDTISLKFYKDENYMHLILEKNPQYNDVVIFPANVVLDIPDIVQRTQAKLPAWRKEG